METLLAIAMTWAVLCILFMIRLEIVFKIRMAAITEIFKYKDWAEKRSLLDDPSFLCMVLDLTKWTFKGFYPEHHARRIARQIAEQDE